jgi:metallothiol transferase
MVKTHGLTHLAIAVGDPERSFHFYQQVFGVVAVYRGDDFIQVQTPGTQEAIVFQKDESRAGGTGGVIHFGFRLTSPDDIGVAVAAVEQAGGRIVGRGEFCPGEPYVFFSDPDGYEVEIWFEPEPPPA